MALHRTGGNVTEIGGTVEPLHQVTTPPLELQTPDKQTEESDTETCKAVSVNIPLSYTVTACGTPTSFSATLWTYFLDNMGLPSKQMTNLLSTAA